MNPIKVGLAILACASGMALSAPAGAGSNVQLRIAVGTPIVPVVPVQQVYYYGYRPPVVYYPRHYYWRPHPWHYYHGHDHWRGGYAPPAYRPPAYRPGFGDAVRPPRR